MSIYATVNDNEPAFFSSTQGWKDVAEWADDLTEEQFEELIHLVEHGYSEELETVAVQIAEAVQENPPSEEVGKTLIELLELLEGETGEVIINSGMEP